MAFKVSNNGIILDNLPRSQPHQHPNDTLPADSPLFTHILPSIAEVLKCGPLLRYIGTSYANPSKPIWRGSVMIITEHDDEVPQLELYNGMEENEEEEMSHEGTKGVMIHVDPYRGRCFWRYGLEVSLVEKEKKVTYCIFGEKGQLRRSFWVPGREESMSILFYSCNGFSGMNDASFSGPALWNDVLRVHAQKPFHVMIGGGDQIYNDNVRVTGPLKSWAESNNPAKRRRYPWTPELEAEIDEWYYNNYVEWYNTPPFKHARSQIPQVNIWDGHDIIDGYGSYTDSFMRCPVFRGIGRVARKYYLLFQHQTPPTGENPEDPCWILGEQPGRYIQEVSRSLFCRLGKHIAFLGVDARAERTRHMVNMPETYDLMFERLKTELTSEEGRNVRHLVILLGVPIAYPRFVWLENIIKSPLIGIVRFLNKRFGCGGALFNKFDGEIDILDDLDDHYCARPHKHERNAFILRLQEFSCTHNIRITILSGDVHLAAVGRFYSNPELNIPTSLDHRYMVNMISSAIMNKPPPIAISNLLSRRNKVHHLGTETEEQLLDFFDKDVCGKPRTNKNTMPARNYCVISESTAGEIDEWEARRVLNGKAKKKSIVNAVGPWEEGAGANHPASAPTVTAETGKGSLNLSIRVEIDKRNRDGKTIGYGLAIPPLERERGNFSWAAYTA